MPYIYGIIEINYFRLPVNYYRLNNLHYVSCNLQYNLTEWNCFTIN